MKSSTSQNLANISGPTPDCDSVLVAACVDGDQRAWIKLLERYKRLIYSVSVRFGFDHEDRHDVFQAVCVEVLKNLSSLRNSSSLRYWILTITVRQCCALRKRLKEEDARGGCEPDLLTCDPKSDSMEIYLAARRAEMLRETLDELPDPCRSLLNLLFFSEEKTPYSELGARFGWSKDTIGSARLRCLDRMRKILAQKGF
jgi:RNA polymerase sigma factor (sigma-70 family)